jgi:3-hydroxyisobutyrate dehydrogenase-like beta-hydroxyacid dehydrogenase
MSQQQTVAVLGAGGIMGRPMAANLCKAGATYLTASPRRDG